MLLPIAAAVKKKKVGKLGPIAEKIVLPVETDASKLVKYVCGSNIYKTGEDILVGLVFDFARLEICSYKLNRYKFLHIRF